MEAESSAPGSPPAEVVEADLNPGPATQNLSYLTALSAGER